MMANLPSTLIALASCRKGGMYRCISSPSFNSRPLSNIYLPVFGPFLAVLTSPASDDEFDGDMGDMWPSAVPNRLGGQGEAETIDGEASVDLRASCLGLPLSLPYEVETLAEMDDRLELICCRLVECVKAREWGMGFRNWDAALGV